MYDPELDQFKRDIHLVQYAVERHGYLRDRRESSRLCHVLRRATTHDKIVVRQSLDGHWTYFSIRDNTDNGTIIDFVQHRGTRGLGEVRRELRHWLGTPRPAFEFSSRQAVRPSSPHGRFGVADAFAAARRENNSLYLNARGIRPETLRDDRFAGTWRIDARGKVLFAHRDEAGALTGFEIKNRGFTGFAAGGRKTAWQSSRGAGDRALVITESAIDALSHHQLHRLGGARYLSTAGTLSAYQHATLDALLTKLTPTSIVVAAVDADEGGTRLAVQLETIVRRHPHVLFTRHSPEPSLGKDWNDVLRRVESTYIDALPAVRRLSHHPDAP